MASTEANPTRRENRMKTFACLRNRAPGPGGTHGLFPTGELLPFILVTALFLPLGIPNNLNDVLIRQFMKSFAICDLGRLVAVRFLYGYFVVEMPAALLMRKGRLQGGFVWTVSVWRRYILFWPAAIVGKV